MIEFDRIAIPFPDQALNCTDILYCDVTSPSVFVRCDSGFAQIVFNFFQILSSTHRVHGCEENWLPVPSEAFSSWDQSTFDYGVHFENVPDVGRWTRQSHPVSNNTLSCNVGSTGLPPECHWVAVKYKKCLEELGVKQCWNLFFGPPPFAKEDIQSLIDHCKVPANFTLNSSRKSSDRTAPSSSRGMFLSCRSILIMNFDTAEQLWLNVDVYPFPFTNKNVIGRQIHNKFRSWFSLRNRSPSAYEQLNVPNGNFLWRFCDEILDPIHNTNPWSCLVFYQGFNHDINAITSFVRINFHIQDCADFRIRTNPPFWDFEVVWILDVLSAYPQSPLQLWWIAVLSQSSLRNQRRIVVSTISDHQEVLRIFVRILATSSPVPMMLKSERWRQHWKFCRYHHRSPNLTFGLISWIWIQLFAQICDCSSDTELIDRNNIAKNQFNGFFTSVEVNGLLSTAIQFSSFPGVPQVMSLHINMKIIFPLNCSGSHSDSATIFWISLRIPNVANPGKFFHSNSIDSPSIRSKSLR